MAAPAANAAAPLVDAQGRRVTYLRLSLTDRCNFRCSYCAPAGAERAADALGRPALARLVRVFAGLGIRRVRLTGGEPTLRPDLLEVVRDVAAAPGIAEIALTTNGHALATLAGPLRAAASRASTSPSTRWIPSGCTASRDGRRPSSASWRASRRRRGRGSTP